MVFSDDLSFLTSLITDLVASPYSDFYRTLYGVPTGSIPNLNSWDDWNLVPTFTKGSILELAMHAYTFVAHKDIDTIYYPSGTSGKPPVFCPRVAYAGGLPTADSFTHFPVLLYIQ